MTDLQVARVASKMEGCPGEGVGGVQEGGETFVEVFSNRKFSGLAGSVEESEALFIGAFEEGLLVGAFFLGQRTGKRFFVFAFGEVEEISLFFFRERYRNGRGGPHEPLLGRRTEGRGGRGLGGLSEWTVSWSVARF